MMKSFDDLEKAFEKGLNEWQQNIFEREANKIGGYAAAEVKRLTPVDTGHLRRRWTVKVDRSNDQMVIWIVNNTQYAAAVNYGHRIVRGGKTVGKTKGFYMLEKGMDTYRRTKLEPDIRSMLDHLREVF